MCMPGVSRKGDGELPVRIFVQGKGDMGHRKHVTGSEETSKQGPSSGKHEIAKRLCVAEMPRLPQLHQKMSLSQ